MSDLEAAQAPHKGKPKPKPTIQYKITLIHTSPGPGPGILKKTSKKNVLTFANLAPGSYSASYQASGMRGKKMLFTTPPSLPVSFMIN